MRIAFACVYAYMLGGSAWAVARPGPDRLSNNSLGTAQDVAASRPITLRRGNLGSTVLLSFLRRLPSAGLIPLAGNL